MKTIEVIYLKNNTIVPDDISNHKKYSFNTHDEVFEKNIIKLGSTTNLYVVKVHDKMFKYFNPSTGELLESEASDGLFKIRTLIIVPDDNVAIGQIQN